MTRAPKRRRRGSDHTCTKDRMSRALKHLRFLHMLPKIELPKKFTDEEIVKQMEKEIPEQYMSFQTMFAMKKEGRDLNEDFREDLQKFARAATRAAKVRVDVIGCRHWISTGSCRHGDKCRFAHTRHRTTTADKKHYAEAVAKTHYVPKEKHESTTTTMALGVPFKHLSYQTLTCSSGTFEEMRRKRLADPSPIHRRMAIASPINTTLTRSRNISTRYSRRLHKIPGGPTIKTRAHEKHILASPIRQVRRVGGQVSEYV